VQDAPLIPTKSGASRVLDVLLYEPWRDRSGQWRLPKNGEPRALERFHDLVGLVLEAIDRYRVDLAEHEADADRAERDLLVKDKHASPEAIEHARRTAAIDAAKKRLLLLVPGSFSENRRTEDRCNRITCYFADADDLTETEWAVTVDRLKASGVAWASYASPKDGIPKPEAPERHVRRRVIVATSRDVNGEEAEALQRALPVLLGFRVDQKATDRARGFYVGTVGEREPDTDGCTDGDLVIDVDSVLAQSTAAPKATAGSSTSAPPKTASKPTDTPPDRTDDDLVAAIEAAQTAEPAISGDGGHDRCFAAACWVAAWLGPDPDAIEWVLAEHYSPRCDPSWSAVELRHKAEDASKALRPMWRVERERRRRQRNHARGDAANGTDAASENDDDRGLGRPQSFTTEEQPIAYLCEGLRRAERRQDFAHRGRPRRRQWADREPSRRVLRAGAQSVRRASLRTYERAPARLRGRSPHHASPSAARARGR
jgi:hypothetical protein